MRESRLFIILISLVMGLAGCSKETMIGEYVDRCAVRLDIDWGPCGIDPDGMTALFTRSMEGSQAVSLPTR